MTGDCERCGQRHEACHAHARGTDGREWRPCLVLPHRSAVTCWRHGGGTAASARKHARAEALERLGLEAVRPVDAVAALGEMMAVSAATVDLLAECVAQAEAETSVAEVVEGPLWAAWGVERGRLARLARDAIMAGLDERRASVAEAEVALLAAAVAGALGDAEVSGPTRDRALSALAERLRALPRP
ncbi:MAG: hypothetical protein ACRD0D_00910 [Acidimicrobiales bacterium]